MHTVPFASAKLSCPSSMCRQILHLMIILFVLALPTIGHCWFQDNAQISPFSAELMERINTYRYQHGLGTLQFNGRLNQLARQHSMDMYRQRRMSHQGFDDRFRYSGSHLCVENVGWHYSTPAKQFEGWQHSSGHRSNMLEPSVVSAGIAEVGGYVTFFACR